MLEKLQLLRAYLTQGLDNLLAKAKQDWKDIWNADKGYFFLFGGVILLIKFRQILIDLIVSNAKAIFTSAQKTSDKDQNAENKVNQQANTLVQQAEQLPTKQPSVDPDWSDKP